MFLSFSDLAGGKSQLIFPTQKLNLADKEAANLYMKQYTEDVCNHLSLLSLKPDSKLKSFDNIQIKCIVFLMCKARSALL